MYVVTSDQLREMVFAIMREYDGLRAMQPMTEERYLSRKEVSKLLDASLMTLSTWAKKKYLVPVKVGRRVLYKKSDIDNLTNNSQK